MTFVKNNPGVDLARVLESIFLLFARLSTPAGLPVFFQHSTLREYNGLTIIQSSLHLKMHLVVRCRAILHAFRMP